MNQRQFAWGIIAGGCGCLALVCLCIFGALFAGCFGVVSHLSEPLPEAPLDSSQWQKAPAHLLPKELHKHDVPAPPIALPAIHSRSKFAQVNEKNQENWHSQLWFTYDNNGGIVLLCLGKKSERGREYGFVGWHWGASTNYMWIVVWEKSGNGCCGVSAYTINGKPIGKKYWGNTERVKDPLFGLTVNEVVLLIIQDLCDAALRTIP